MKKFLFLVLIIGAGFSANASTDIYCMTTNQHFCMDCDPQAYCRITYDIERITNDNGHYQHSTLAYGICDEEANVVLDSPACK